MTSNPYYRAAEYIERHGLCQRGGYTDGDLPLQDTRRAVARGEMDPPAACVYGALYMANPGITFDAEAVRDARLERLVETIADAETPYLSVPIWNDRRDTTAEDAILLLKRAGRDLEAAREAFGSRPCG